VSGEPPTRFENYPPEPEAKSDPTVVNKWEAPPSAPVVRPYQPSTRSVSTAPAEDRSRRTVILGLGGVVAVGGLMWAYSSSSANQSLDTGGSGAETEDPFDPSTEEPDDSTSFDLGGTTFEAPQGWTVAVATDTAVQLTQGANQMMLVSYFTEASDPAAEIVNALERSHSPFVGSAGRPKVDATSGDDRATMTGTGKYRGKVAHQLVDLWLDSANGQALFIRRVLTADEASSIAKQARRLIADVNDSWPW